MRPSTPWLPLTIGLLTLALSLVLLKAPASSVAAANTTLTLSASSSPAGAGMRAAGSGFNGGETVKLRWNAISGPVLAQIVGVGGGAFTDVAFTVPQVSPGSYTVWAIGDASSNYAVADLTVTEGSATATATATVAPTATATSTPTPTATPVATATPIPTPVHTPAPGITTFPAGPLPSAGAPMAVAVNAAQDRIYAVHRSFYRDLGANGGLLPTDRVSVVDRTNGGVITTIPVGRALNGAGQGIAFNALANRLYVTNADDDTVSVIDTTTNTVIATVPAGKGPEGIGVDPDIGVVYVANGAGKSVTLLDATTGATTATIPLAGGVHSVAVDRSTHLAYVTVNAAPWTVITIDGRTKTAQAQVPLNLVFSLSGIAVDPGFRVYALDHDTGTVSIIDINTTDNKPPAYTSRFAAALYGEAIAVDTTTRAVYVADGGNDTVNVFDTAALTVGSIATLRMPSAIAIDSASRRAYVADALSDSLTVLDMDRLAVSSTVPLGISNFGIAYDPTTKRIYSGNFLADAISVVDATAQKVVGSWLADTGPWAVAVDPALKQVYSLNLLTGAGGKGTLTGLSTVDGRVLVSTDVGAAGAGQVAVSTVSHRVYATGGKGLTVLDGVTNAVIARVTVGNTPVGIAIDDVAQRVYVANQQSGTISVIDSTTNQVIATWTPKFGNVWGLAVDPGLRRLFVTVPPNLIGDFTGLEILDSTTGAFIGQVPTASRAALVAVNPVTHQVFMTDSAGGTVTVVDGATGAAQTTIAVGNLPHAVTIDPDSGLAYVGNAGDGTIATIDPSKLGGIPTPTPVPTATAQPVGPTGGAVALAGGASADGGITVSVPSNAFSGTVNLTVSVTGAAPDGVTTPSGAVMLPKTFDVTPDQPVILGATVRIRINLTAAELGTRNITDIRIGTVIGKSIDLKPTRVIDAAQAIVEVEVDHFTKFSVLAADSPVPVLSGPGDGAVLNSLGPTLAWANPAGTTQYQIQVIPFNGDGPGVNLIRNVETSYTVKAPEFGAANPNYVMLPGMTYIWRVRTTSSASFAPESDPSWSVWSLRTFRTPPASTATISLTSPAEGSTVANRTPTLTWANSDASGFYYEVQVSQDPNFNADPATAIAAVYWELRHGGVTAPPNSYTVPAGYPLEPGGTYYWRVRSRVQGDGVPLAWSRTATFHTP